MIEDLEVYFTPTTAVDRPDADPTSLASNKSSAAAPLPTCAVLTDRERSQLIAFSVKTGGQASALSVHSEAAARSINEQGTKDLVQIFSRRLPLHDPTEGPLIILHGLEYPPIPGQKVKADAMFMPYHIFKRMAVGNSVGMEAKTRASIDMQQAWSGLDEPLRRSINSMGMLVVNPLTKEHVKDSGNDTRTTVEKADFALLIRVPRDPAGPTHQGATKQDGT